MINSKKMWKNDNFRKKTPVPEWTVRSGTENEEAKSLNVKIEVTSRFSMQFFITCTPGVESVLKREIEKIGGLQFFC